VIREKLLIQLDRILDLLVLDDLLELLLEVSEHTPISIILIVVVILLRVVVCFLVVEV